MFTCLAILRCHLVCGGRETKSPCKSYAEKKRNKKRKGLGHQMMFIAPHIKLQLQGITFGVHWVIAYGHKNSILHKKRRLAKIKYRLFCRQGFYHLFNFFVCIQRNPSRLISKQLGRKEFSMEELPIDS